MPTPVYRPHSFCRVCRAELPPPTLDLGSQPLANDLPLVPHGLVTRAPLAVTMCPQCRLGQLTVVVNPDLLFSSYLYTPGQSASFTAHLEELASFAAGLLSQAEDPFAVDIGSNDGTLLRALRDRHGFRILGVEPAVNLASQALADGIPTTNQFWSGSLGRALYLSKGKADLITATNVFAHLDNVHDFLNGVEALLRPTTGRAIIEVCSLPAMVQSGTFDLVYHEHLSYWTPEAFYAVVSLHHLAIDNITFNAAHGGSMRVVLRHGEPTRLPSVYATEPADFDLTRLAVNAGAARDAFWSFLQDYPSTAGYTAPAKATVFLNYAGAPDALPYVVDDNPLKQGRYIPGTSTPILPRQALIDRPVEGLVVFAWNLVEDVVARVQGIGVRRLFIPLPRPQVVTIPLP